MSWEQEWSAQISIPIQGVRLDRIAFEKFRARYRDKRAIDDQKRLEYYISTCWLEFEKRDTFIDIAAQDCPFATYVRQTYGCRAYRQDLYYLKPGIHGFDIGGDATNLPLPDGSVTKMALHNSFEHFEGDSDTRLIYEARRVLVPGGKLLIVPLFIGETYTEETDAGWVDEKGAKHLWGIGARFARIYDVTQFRARVLAHADGFDVRVYRADNVAELAAQAYLHYFIIFQKR
jgi:SAM-dependent methyltransferase